MRDRPPASIKIDSKVYPVADISEAGLLIDGYEGDLVAKQRVYFDLIIPLDDKERTFRAEATITRLQDKRLVAKFNDLRRDARAAIAYIVAHANAPLPGAAKPS